MQAKFWNLGAIALCAAALAIPAGARDLTVVSWGGDYQDAQRDAYFKPFMQTTGDRHLSGADCRSTEQLPTRRRRPQIGDRL